MDWLRIILTKIYLVALLFAWYLVLLPFIANVDVCMHQSYMVVSRGLPEDRAALDQCYSSIYRWYFGVAAVAVIGSMPVVWPWASNKLRQRKKGGAEAAPLVS
jgi:hypothetical protein